MTVSPRDIQSSHYCYRAQRYDFLPNPPNYDTKYNIDYQLININQLRLTNPNPRKQEYDIKKLLTRQNKKERGLLDIDIQQSPLFF